MKRDYTAIKYLAGILAYNLIGVNAIIYAISGDYGDALLITGIIIVSLVYVCLEYIIKIDNKVIDRSDYTYEEFEAIRRFEIGEPYYISCVHEEDRLTAGYGETDINGEVQYPLPITYIRQIYKTTSYSTYLKMFR